MVQNLENQNTQDVLPFKGKITTVIFYEPETGFAIFKIRQEGETKSSTAKGYVPNPVAGAKIFYNGTWKEDQKFGGYYIAISNSKIDYAGGGKDAIIELLSSDFVPGVGPTVAKKIVDHFGKDALRVIEREPERLKEISGIGVKSADKIHEGYMHIANDQQLIALLLPYLSIQKINSVIKKFGTGKMALEEIKENPYVLYQKFSGIGFATADKVALGGCQIARDDIRRVTAILLYALETQAQMAGNTFIWVDDMYRVVKETMRNVLHEVAFPDEVIRKAATIAREDGLVVVQGSKPTDGRKPMFCMYLYKYWFYECDIAYLCTMIHTNSNSTYGLVDSQDVDDAIEIIEAEDGFSLDDTQKNAVRTVFGSDIKNVTVITGGPGSGKTTIIKTIIKTWQIARGLRYNEDSMLLCAPTGRASARMREATEHPASTIQSAYYSMHGDCEASIIVVDEFSMCNLETAHMVFELASHGCKLVIVGDPDQLPAIGAGNVLRDLIQSGVVNVCKLSSCHRNVGSIVENAIHINTGETTETFKQDEQFALIPAKGKEMRNIALSNYFAYVEKYGEQVTEKNADTAEVYEEGIKQVCLLTPTKKKGCGSLSATDMNLLIRDELNPATDANSWFFSNFKKKAKPEQGFEYRLGDRVMLCKNHKNSFVNGDMGFIVDYQEKALDPNTSGTIHHAYTIRFDNPCDVEGRVYTMLVSRKTLQSEFSLAYAMTVHKSQGSEFKAVVIGLEKSWSRLLQRNLLYTAVTRAKKECRIIGEMKTVDEAILTNDIEYRNTLLESRLTHFDRERYETIHRRNVEDNDSDWRDDDD